MDFIWIYIGLPFPFLIYMIVSMNNQIEEQRKVIEQLKIRIELMNND